MVVRNLKFENKRILNVPVPYHTLEINSVISPKETQTLWIELWIWIWFWTSPKSFSRDICIPYSTGMWQQFFFPRYEWNSGNTVNFLEYPETILTIEIKE